MSFLSVDAGLCLRNLTIGDAGALFGLTQSNSDRVNRFVQVETAVDVQKTRQSIQGFESAHLTQSGLYLGIFMHETLIGQIRLELVPRTTNAQSNVVFCCSIAYWIGDQFTGNGVAYRCLRALLPHACETHWTNKIISHFEAEIRFDNLPSQRVVQRLGFQTDMPKDNLSLVLSVVAPRITEIWTLPAGPDLRDRFVLSEAQYLASPVRGRPNPNSQETLISLISDCLSQLDSGEDHEDSRALIPELTVAEAKLKRKLSVVAPNRVLADDSSSFIWCDLENLQGLWSDLCEENFRIVVCGTHVLKGFMQPLERDANGHICIAGYVYNPDLSDETHLVFSQQGAARNLEWTRLEGCTAHSIMTGTFRTPRGYVALLDEQLVSAQSLWKLVCRDHTWYLVQGQARELSLESAASDSLVWVANEPVKRMRRSTTVEVVTWSRKSGTAAVSFADHMIGNFKSRLCKAMIRRISAEIRLLKLCSHDASDPSKHEIEADMRVRKESCEEIDMIHLVLVLLGELRRNLAIREHSYAELASTLSDILQDIISSDETPFRLNWSEYFP